MSSSMDIDISVVDTIGPHIVARMALMGPAAEHVLERGAREMQDYAQFNAPWEDRTGDARQGLHADVDSDDGEYVISLAGGVDYQIYLELKDNGKYAIIMPTVEALGPRILAEAAVAAVIA